MSVDGIENLVGKVAFAASDADMAQDALERLTDRYGQCAPSEAHVVVALGGDGFDLVAPVYADSRVRLTRRYTAARESKSRPDVGIVTIEDRLTNQDGELVYRTSGSMFVSKRPA